MSPISSIGLAEVFILVSFAGLPLLIGVIAVAVILATRKKSDVPVNDPGAIE